MTRPVWCLLLLLTASAPQCGAAGEDFLRQGEGYLAERAYDKAVRAFRQAARIDPGSAAAFRGLGWAYYNLGNGETASFPQLLEEAVAAYQKALGISSDAGTLYNLGMAYLMAGNFAEARRVRQSLSALDRDQANLLAFKIGAEQDRHTGKEALVTVINGTEKTISTGQRTEVRVQNNQVWVPVTFGHKGRTVAAWLLMDTGATSTTIPPAIARQLGVTAAETRTGKARIADGSVVQTDDVVLDQVRVGPKEKRSLTVKIIQGAAGLGFGLLGLDFLGEFLYAVDTRKGVIHWQ